jgi:hypothetical protein
MASQREEHHLKGAVRLVRAKKSRLDESGSVPQAVELRSRTSIYDRAGKMIESSFYNSRGVLQNTISYKYDTAGREIELSEYDGSGSVIRRSVSIYDDNGRPKSECIYLADGSTLVQRSATVNLDGKRIVEAFYQLDAEPQEQIDSAGKGRVSLERKSDRNYRTIEVWDTDEKPLEIIVYNEDGSARGKFVYAYNAEGRRIREARYAPLKTSASGFEDVPVIETIYAYNEAGLISEILNLSGGSARLRTVYYYDDDGNKTKAIKYEADGRVSQIETYDREFDQQGNWITETKTKLYPQRGNRTLYVVTRRDIEYY